MPEGAVFVPLQPADRNAQINEPKRNVHPK